MIKREEIREVLLTLCAMAKARDLSKSPTGFDDDVDWAILELHLQGCVLKVDRKLPRNPYGELEIIDDVYAHRSRKIYREAQQYLLNSGYVAVEPLIEV